MPNKPKHFCSHAGCKNLTTCKYCEAHQSDAEEAYKARDRRRGTAAERGYNYRWAKCSKAYLSHPDHQICKLHLPGCTLLAECVDHIIPVNGPYDPNFWREDNWQASCGHCNTLKGKRMIKGTFEL